MIIKVFFSKEQDELTGSKDIFALAHPSVCVCMFVLKEVLNQISTQSKVQVLTQHASWYCSCIYVCRQITTSVLSNLSRRPPKLPPLIFSFSFT